MSNFIWPYQINKNVLKIDWEITLLGNRSCLHDTPCRFSNNLQKRFCKIRDSFVGSNFGIRELLVSCKYPPKSIQMYRNQIHYRKWILHAFRIVRLKLSNSSVYNIYRLRKQNYNYCRTRYLWIMTFKEKIARTHIVMGFSRGSKVSNRHFYVGFGKNYK